MDPRTTVEVKAGDDTYRLRISTNAMVRYEVASGGESLIVACERLQDDEAPEHLTRFRRLFWAALVGGGHDISEDEAGDIIDAMGGVSAAGARLGAAVAAAFPSAVGNGAQPPKKAARRKAT